MPKKLEEELRKRAESMHLPKDRADAYVYGTLRDTGWTPSTQKKGSSQKKGK
jgi:hypothetical protein